MKQRMVKLVERNVDEWGQDSTFFLCPNQSARHFGLKLAFSLRFFLAFLESARHFGSFGALYTLYICRQLVGLKCSAIRRVYA